MGYTGEYKGKKLHFQDLHSGRETKINEGKTQKKKKKKKKKKERKERKKLFLQSSGKHGRLEKETK